jgi:predicted ATPase
VREGFKTAQHSDATQRLLSALDGRELLLLLDNCEHLIEDTARLTGLLLGACPEVRVLATSREALGITGEVLCPLPPLAPRSAVALFADRAAAVRPGFTTDDAAERICAALDGLPLAIELAAARLRTLTVDEITARLDDRFRLLSRGDRTKAPRHRTLRAVVEWSWELLDEAERELARRLTVFAGSASPDAVEYVCEVTHPGDLLASLAEKSFVEVADGRYRMLETIRAFCAEQLEASGEEERLRAAHAAYFLWLAETAEPFLRGAEQLRWLERLDAEHGNLSAALRRFVRTDRESALRLMAALSWFWRLRGLYGEIAPLAAELLTAVGPEPPAGLEEEYVLCVLNAVTGQGDPLEQERVDRAGAVMAGLDRPLRLPFTLVLWSLAGGPLVGDEELARKQMGDDRWGLAVYQMGQGYRELFFAGRPQESEAAFAQALAGFRAAGDRWGAANCLDPLAMFAGWRGDRERALTLLDEALVLVQELGAPEETADLLHRRATVLLQTGDLAGAAEHDMRACELARSVGVTDKVASARRGLGDAARLSGDTAAARAHYEAALEACAANWFSVGESVRIFIGLGRTAGVEGRDDEALEWYEQARALALEQPGLIELAEVAEALAEAGPPERSAMLLGAAEALRGTVVAGDPDVVRVREVARAGLSPEAYEKAYRRGRALRSAAVSER